MTVYRMFPDAHKWVVAVLRQLDDTVPLANIFQQADVQADVFTVRLVDSQVVDPDAVRAEWQGLQVLQGVVVVPSAIDDAEFANRRQRATRVADVIGPAAVDEERLAAQIGDCESILLTAIELVIG